MSSRPGSAYPLQPREIVMQVAIPAGAAILLITVALVAALVLDPRYGLVALHWYTIAVGSIVVLALLRLVIIAFPVRQEGFLRPARKGPGGNRPDWLEQLEHLVGFSRSNAGDFYYRLRPILRDIAAYRLAWHRGVDAERNPEAARAILGDEMRDLLWMPGDQLPDRHGPGIELSRLEAIVGRLEEI